MIILKYPLKPSCYSYIEAVETNSPIFAIIWNISAPYQ